MYNNGINYERMFYMMNLISSGNVTPNNAEKYALVNFMVTVEDSNYNEVVKGNITSYSNESVTINGNTYRFDECDIFVLGSGI